MSKWSDLKMNQKLIKSKDRFPSTHHFLYKEKKYPIKTSFFLLSSKYFQDNQKEIDQCQEIQLIDEESEENIDFSEKSIKEFIQYVEQEEISLNQDNIVSLHYLGTKYKVNSLIEDIKEYIEEYQNELALENLLIHQNDQLFETEIYEKIISDNFHNYIKSEKIFKIKFPVLCRILSKSEEKINKKIKEEEKLEFYFTCLDKFGRVASILFKFADFDKYDPKYLNLLMTKYSEIFDFQLIDPKILKKLYENQNILNQTLKNKEEEIIRLKEIIEQKNQEIEKLKSDNELKICEQKKSYESKIFDKDDEIKKLRAEIEQIKDQNKMLQMKNEEENKKLKDEIKILKEEETKLKSQSNKIQSNAISNQIKTFTQKQDEGKDGIIHYFEKISNNKNDPNLIDMYIHMGYDPFSCRSLRKKYKEAPIFGYNDDEHWILFNFKNHQIEVSSYVIQSSEYRKDCTHLKSWTIEISNDLKTWEIIDEHLNSSELNGPNICKSFNVKKNHFAHYCLLKSSDDFYGKEKNWELEIDHIEFYGIMKL